MTVQEEIEQLKTQLSQTADEQEQAELLLELLSKYTSLRSIDSKPLIDRLLQLADKIKSVHYRAWALFYLSIYDRLTGKKNDALGLGRQALLLFEQVNNLDGIARAYNNQAGINQELGNYAEGLKDHLRALEVREKIGDRTGIANTYNHIGVNHFLQGNFQQALKYIYLAFDIRKELGNKLDLAHSYNNIGITLYNMGDYAEALKNHQAALELDVELNDKPGIAISYNNMGTIYLQQGNYPDALKSQLHALRIHEELGDNSSIIAACVNIGLIYLHQHNYVDALKMLRRGLRIAEQAGDKKGIASVCNNSGMVNFKQGDYKGALENYFRSLRITEEIGDKQGMGSVYNNIGRVYEKQGNYIEALKNLERGLEISKAIDDKKEAAHSYNHIGEVLEKTGRHAEAIENQLMALRTGEEIGNKDLVKESSLSLTNTYKSVGDFKNALLYHEKYHQVESEILGEESQKQLTNLSFTHNLEQKEKDLEIEQLRNVELKKERDRSENLLLNILPSEVADELKEKGAADAKLFDNVTVLFTDFKDFTKVSERLTPQELVDELNTCFSAFDHIISKYRIEKIKTVGDAYLAVAGLPLANAGHAEMMINAAMEIRDFMRERLKVKGERSFHVRIGIHSGSVVAGIVGVKKFAYDIWGDTVNTAARMEQNGKAGKINISEATYLLVKNKFTCKYRGDIEAKNKGRLKMYFVD